MKKRLQFLAVFTLLIAFGFSSNSALRAQCVVNPPSSNVGFYPDPAPAGCLNQQYAEVVQFVFPLDTLVAAPPFGTFLIPFDSFTVDSFGSVPLGISIAQSAPNGVYYPVSSTVAAQGCVDITGIPTDTTTLTNNSVLVYVTACVTAFGQSQCGQTVFALTFEINNSPTANFTFSSALNAVTFTNTSTIGGSATYMWDFGDGNTSTMKNPPTHNYPAGAGLYNCCLIVDNGNCSDTTCQNITVGCPAPTVMFNTAINQLSATFTDQTPGNPSSWLWDFGDGNTSSMQNPGHIYAAAGTYTVCLTVTDSCGTDSSCAAVTACNNPLAVFMAASTGLALTLTDQSTSGSTISAWAWDFGDGGTSSMQNPTYNYTAPGSYQVCLIVTDACGSDTSCVNETISCSPGTAGYSWTAINLDVTFTNTTTSSNSPSYSWDFGDSSPASTQTNPSHTFTTDGTYYVCVEMTDACGTDVFCDSVSVMTVGLEENLLFGGIHLFPNPANEVISIRFEPKQALRTELKIVDMMGKTLHSIDLGTVSGVFEQNISLNGFPSGIYFVQLHSEKGNTGLKFIKN